MTSDDRLIELVERCDEWAGRPFTDATELAERLEITRQAARHRLENLVKQGEIQRHKPSRDVIYWSD